jgi:F-type H+-transporting ATPase subunit delta
MSGEIAAKRYANALFELAKENNSLEQTEEELRSLGQAVEASRELQNFLQSPQIATAVKKEQIGAIFSGKVSEHVLSLLLLLVDRHREDLLGDLVDEFIKLTNDARGIVDATVYSASLVKEEELKAIAEQFGAKLKKTLRVSNVVDPGIIGGLVIRIGDRIYDGSIKGKLARFEQSLA